MDWIRYSWKHSCVRFHQNYCTPPHSFTFGSLSLEVFLFWQLPKMMRRDSKALKSGWKCGTQSYISLHDENQLLVFSPPKFLMLGVEMHNKDQTCFWQLLPIHKQAICNLGPAVRHQSLILIPVMKYFNLKNPCFNLKQAVDLWAFSPTHCSSWSGCLAAGYLSDPFTTYESHFVQMKQRCAPLSNAKRSVCACDRM